MKKKLIPPLLLIIAVVFAAYFHSLSNPFIWDDEALVLKNPLIRTSILTPKIFTSDLYNGISAGSNFYRPLQTLSYALDYKLWRFDPLGYHLTNIILQAAASCLVLILFFILTRNPAISLTASLLFALNPLSAEAVAYVSGRAEMLLGICLLASLILFVKSLDSRYGVYLYIFSSLFFILGLLSKELALVFPLVLFAYLFYFKRLDAKGRLSLIPFFLIAAAYLILRLTVLKFLTLRPPALTDVPFYLRISVLPEVLLTYFRLLLLPVDLHMSRTLVRPTSFFGFFFAWLALGLIVAWCIKIFRNEKGRKVFPFMVFWFFVFILPQSGLLAINAFVSEHFIYLSSLSLFLGLAFILHKYLKPKLFIIISSVFILFYGLLTTSRVYDWKDPLVFYRKIIRYSPDSFQAHNNLGLQYEFRGDLEAAAGEYKKAIAIKPDLLEAHSNLANLYFKKGMIAEAKREYAVVEKLAPAEKAGEIQNNMGCVYEVEGNLEEALKRYRLALRLDPSLNFAHFNIARIYLARNDKENAVKEILKSLPEVHPSGGISQLIRELLSSPGKVADGAVFYNDLGVRLGRDGDFSEASQAFKRSLELRPMYADAHFNLGLAYWNMGRRREAIFELREAVRSGPSGHRQAESFLKESIYKK
jgi:tetratricopeptide (TPR) repeat protein